MMCFTLLLASAPTSVDSLLQLKTRSQETLTLLAVVTTTDKALQETLTMIALVITINKIKGLCAYLL